MGENKVKAICGIRQDLISEGALNRCIADAVKMGLMDPLSGNATLEERVKAMKALNERRAKDPRSRANVATCDACEQDSDGEVFEICPYCGGADEGEPKGAPLAAGSMVVHEGEDVTAKPGDLDRYVAEIRQLQIGSMTGIWLIAQKLREIEQTQAWKQRRTTDGEVAYRTIEAFAQAELGMTRRYMREIMRICSHFSEEQVRLHGVSKLRLMLTATPEEEKKMLEAATGGASKRDLEQMAGRQGSDKKETDGRKDKGRRDDKARDEKPAKQQGTSAITVASVEGKHVVELWKKPKDPKAAKPEDNEPATKVEDAPWGFLDMANDVRAYFTLTRSPKGQLKIVFDVRRVPA